MSCKWYFQKRETNPHLYNTATFSVGRKKSNVSIGTDLGKHLYQSLVRKTTENVSTRNSI